MGRRREGGGNGTEGLSKKQKQRRGRKGKEGENREMGSCCSSSFDCDMGYLFSNEDTHWIQEVRRLVSLLEIGTHRRLWIPFPLFVELAYYVSHPCTEICCKFVTCNSRLVSETLKDEFDIECECGLRIVNEFFHDQSIEWHKRLMAYNYRIWIRGNKASVPFIGPTTSTVTSMVKPKLDDRVEDRIVHQLLEWIISSSLPFSKLAVTTGPHRSGFALSIAQHLHDTQFDRVANYVCFTLYPTARHDTLPHDTFSSVDEKKRTEFVTTVLRRSLLFESSEQQLQLRINLFHQIHEITTVELIESIFQSKDATLKMNLIAIFGPNIIEASPPGGGIVGQTVGKGGAGDKGRVVADNLQEMIDQAAQVYKKDRQIVFTKMQHAMNFVLPNDLIRMVCQYLLDV